MLTWLAFVMITHSGAIHVETEEQIKTRETH